MKKITILLLIFLPLAPSWAQVNAVASYDTAQGLANPYCSDVYLEPDGTVWVGHRFHTAPTLNTEPLSRRSPNGTWDAPFTTAGLPAITVNNSPYQWSSFSVEKIYRTSDGTMWFLPETAARASDMNLSDPILTYKNGTFDARHISLGNFPNMGGVYDMVEDSYGHIWFGCHEGLVKLDAINQNFSTYTPPQVSIVSGLSHSSTKITSLDFDRNNRIVMVTGEPISITANSSLVRIFTPLTNTWEYWTHRDAPWWNATQTNYAPVDVLATRDSLNRIYVSTNGGGLYYIDQSAWSSHQLGQIASFLRGWSHPGYTFPNVYTNLPNFTRELFLDSCQQLWITATSGGITSAFQQMYAVPTTYNADSATYHLFGRKDSQHEFDNNGTQVASSFQDMAFGAQGEFWISSLHGVERWYYDSLTPGSDYIGLEGAGPKKVGAVGFNTYTAQVREPAGKGHTMPTNWPDISIDTAYYYLASADYDNLLPGVSSGIKGNGVSHGFTATEQALRTAGLTFADLNLRFTPVDLSSDKRNQDWAYSNERETRHYDPWYSIQNQRVNAESHYQLLLGNHILYEGIMPVFHLHLSYNRYGYLFDSIGGYSDYIPLTPFPNVTDPDAVAVLNALNSDLGGAGVRFVFSTIQTALDESIRTTDRKGGLYQIYDAYLEKGSGSPPPPPTTPLCGTYHIGQTVAADFATFAEAIAALENRGIICDVRFIVGKGVYLEQVSLGNVVGMENYRITFDGAGSNPTLQYAPTHSDSNYVFQVIGTENLTLKDLRLANHSANYGKVIDLLGTTRMFNLTDCEVSGKLRAPATPRDAREDHILIYSVDSDSATFTASTLIGGSDGLNLNGTHLTISNMICREQTATAMNLDRASDITVLQNRIEGTATGNYRGIEFGGHPFKINGNQILNENGNCLSAISSSSSDVGNPAQPSQIHNNEITVYSASGTSSALSVSCGNVEIMHNSINVLGNNSSFTALQNFWPPAGWIARNNIIVNPAGICFFSSHDNSGAGFPNSDYNIFYSNAATRFQSMVGFTTTDHASLAAFKTATTKENNSLRVDPQFSATTHLLPLNVAANGLGTSLPGVPRDRLRRPRPNLNPDHGCYEFDGNGWTGAVNNDWANPANWSGNQVPGRQGKVFISPQNFNPRIDSCVKVAEFIMHHQANLTIAPDAGLEVDSALNNDGLIILKADTGGHYARLIQGGMKGQGRVTQEAVLRSSSGGLRWFHLGVPVATKVKDLAQSNTSITTGNGASIYLWDAATGNWVSPADTGALLQPGIGYAVAAGQLNGANFLTSSFPGIIDVTGDLRAATTGLNLDLGYTNTPNFNSYTSVLTDGWNFLANPYHAVYDLKDQVMASQYKVVYVWNGSSYKQYNTALNIGDSTARFLAPMQGFFIRTDSNQVASGFTFDPRQRILDRRDQIRKNGSFYPQFAVRVTSLNNSQSDQTFFLEHSAALASFEESYDALKLKNADDHLNLYTLAGSHKLAINVLDKPALAKGVWLGFNSNLEGRYQFTLSEARYQKYEIYLIDHQLQTTVRLDQKPYIFYYKKADLDQRFELYAAEPSVGVKETDAGEPMYLFAESKTLHLHNLPDRPLNLRITDMQGRILYQQERSETGGSWKLDLSGRISSGVYLVILEELGRSFKVVLH